MNERHCIEELCRAIAPHDLDSVPLYILGTSDLPARLHISGSCHGLTIRDGDLVLRDSIPEWRGRGPVIVLNDREIAAAAALDQAPVFDAVVQTAAHELAHVLANDGDMTGWIPASEVAAAAQLEEVIRRCADFDPQPAPGLPPFVGHGGPFLRIALHVRYRAERLGFRFTPARLCSTAWTPLSHPYRYWRALGDEPERMQSATFADIRAARPPADFERLWQSDFAALFKEATAGMPADERLRLLSRWLSNSV